MSELERLQAIAKNVNILSVMVSISASLDGQIADSVMNVKVDTIPRDVDEAHHYWGNEMIGFVQRVEAALVNKKLGINP